MAMPATTELKE